MKQVCAWCTQELGRIESHADRRDEITHGICENCKDNALFQMGVDLGVYLDSLEQPIVMVNQEGVVVTGNHEARELLGKKLQEIEGCRGGEVFECAYSRLPEGCGKTVHCSGCTIRKAVMKTFETGRSFHRVPATLNQNDPNAPEQINLLISTERLADTVLLRIDYMEAKKAA